MSRRLAELAGRYTVARLEPGDPLPPWADGPGFVSLPRTADELSVVCPAERVPADVRQDGPWIAFQLVGPFAFDETGVVLSVIRPLSEGGVGVFVISTFDGDHLLVQEKDSARARTLLTEAGHSIAPAHMAMVSPPST